MYIGEEEHRDCVLFVGEEGQTERHDFPLFRPPGITGSWCQQHRQTTFSSPGEHTDLVVVQQYPRRASVRIMYVVFAVHNVPQVGLLCGSATPESGLCVGPQHQIILVGRHAGCSVVRCPFLRRGFVIEQKGVWF